MLHLPVKGNWLAQATVRDKIEFTDARGALRSLRLVEQAGAGYWAESTQTSYIKPGLKLYLLRMPRLWGRAGHAGYAGEDRGASRHSRERSGCTAETV